MFFETTYRHRENMKKLILVIIALLSINFINTAHARDEVMKVGFLANNSKNGKLDTTLADYFGTILGPAMGVKIQWVGPLPFARILSYLKTGEIHMFYCMAKNDKREQFIHYTDQPSWYARIPMLVRRDSPILKIQGVQDLYGYRIGYCRDMIRPSFFDDPKIQIEYTTGDKWGIFNLKKLKAGRIDIAFFSSMQMLKGFREELAGKLDVDKEFRFIYPPGKILGDHLGKYYDGFSKSSATVFFEKYKEAIKEVGIYWDYHEQHKEE